MYILYVGMFERLLSLVGWKCIDQRILTWFCLKLGLTKCLSFWKLFHKLSSPLLLLFFNSFAFRVYCLSYHWVNVKCENVNWWTLVQYPILSLSDWPICVYFCFRKVLAWISVIWINTDKEDVTGKCFVLVRDFSTVVNNEFSQARVQDVISLCNDPSKSVKIFTS